MFEQSIVFHNVALQNIYNVLYLKTSPMCIFNEVKKMLVALCLNKVSCFIMALNKAYTMYYILKRCQYVIFNAVKKQLGIGFIVDALFYYFACIQ